MEKKTWKELKDEIFAKMPMMVIDSDKENITIDDIKRYFINFHNLYGEAEPSHTILEKKLVWMFVYKDLDFPNSKVHVGGLYDSYERAMEVGLPYLADVYLRKQAMLPKK